jgi:hypothetical protein
MSRLATLCTRRQEYREAVLDLAHLYIDRGYPIKLINKWIKLNLEIRWANRLRDPEERASSVFVLKSHFNPLWDSFNIHEMWDKIRSSWMNSVSSMPWCDNTRCENPAHFSDRAMSSRDAYNVGLKRSHIEYVWSNNELVDIVVDGPLNKRLKLRADGTYVAVGNATGVPSEQAAQPEPVRRYGKTEVFAPRAPAFCHKDPSDLPDPGSFETWLATDRRLASGLERETCFDIRKSDFINRKFLVSRKRNTQLSDLTSQWRRSVLASHMDKQYANIMDVDNWE